MKKTIFATLVALLLASAFSGCNVYEKQEVEVIRCPVIDADTIDIPDWENPVGILEP